MAATSLDDNLGLAGSWSPASFPVGAPAGTAAPARATSSETIVCAACSHAGAFLLQAAPSLRPALLAGLAKRMDRRPRERESPVVQATNAAANGKRSCNGYNLERNARLT